MECPICHCRFDPAIHRWTRSRAAKGRIPGHLWNHQRPDNGKACPYIDAGGVVACTNGTAGGIVTVKYQERDAPDEARMAG